MKAPPKILLFLILIYLLFAPATLSLPFQFIAPIIALLWLGFAVIRPKWGTVAFLSSLWLIQLLVLGMCSGLFFLSAYFLVSGVVVLMAYNLRKRKMGIVLTIAFVAWLVLSTLMTTLPYLLGEILISFVIFSIFAVFLLRMLPDFFFSDRIIKLLVILLFFTAPVVIEAKITQRVSVPSPIQTWAVSAQEGVDVLVPSWKLSGGVRLFSNSDSGYLVMLDKPSFKFWRHIDNNIFYMVLMDEKGNLKEAPLRADYSIDNIVPSPFISDAWYVIGLQGQGLCLLDVNTWDQERCTESDDMHDRIALSPGRKYLASNVDRNSNVHIYDSKSLELLARVDKYKGGCRTGISLAFIDDFHLVEGCLEGGDFFIIEFDGSSNAKVIDRFEVAPGMGKALALAYIPEKKRLIFFESFRIWARLYDLEQRRQVKKKLFLPSFRWIERVGSKDLWCVCSALGFVHFIDSELNVKKTLYCGNKIKSVSIVGDTVHLASQAGLVQIDLAQIGL